MLYTDIQSLRKSRDVCHVLPTGGCRLYPPAMMANRALCASLRAPMPHMFVFVFPAWLF